MASQNSSRIPGTPYLIADKTELQRCPPELQKINNIQPISLIYYKKNFTISIWENAQDFQFFQMLV
jgi:hypothetical protein